MQKHTVRYLHLPPDGDLPAWAGAAHFKAIVVVEAEVMDMTRWEVSRWLVESGCAYALAWGTQAEAWHEAIDDAFLEATDYEEVDDARLLLSTSHEDEDLEEAFWFAKHRATHPAHDLAETLILHIADAPRREQIEASFRDA